VNLQTFDLNDISREPTDEQLEALMKAVTAEARRHSSLARAQRLRPLGADVSAIKRRSRQEYSAMRLRWPRGHAADP